MGGKKGIRNVLLILLLGLTACDRGLGPDTVARAGDFRLSAEEAALMVAPVPELPTDPGVVEAVADFWMDYALLAWAVNQEGELASIDIGPLLEVEVAQEVVVRLRNQVIQVDTTISDEDLRVMYDEERPGEEIRASHILLQVPEGATPAQSDSVRALAEDIRDRARAGTSFSELASEYSDDPGSAASGGDLGFFGRGMMVPPFEEAAFALSPGEVSDVVPSDFGLHVIRLEERRTPTFEEIADDYRQQLQWEWTLEAETFFLDQLEGAANMQLEDGAAQLVKDLAARSDLELSGRETGRALTVFEGGRYTLGDLRRFLLAQPMQVREQIQMAPDEQIDAFLLDLTRERLLLADAERRGIGVDPAEIEAYEAEFREQYVMIADYLGLTGIQPQEGENLRQAIDREVKALMGRLVRGEQELAPLENLAPPLRAAYGAEISEAGIGSAVSQIEELRAQGFQGDVPR